MKLRTLITRKGVFSQLETNAVGVDKEAIRLWRKVIDENLVAAISANTSAKRAALEWVNSKPGDIIVIKTDDNELMEVDNYEEFCTVCFMADLEPDFVRRTFLEVLDRLKKVESE